MPCNLSVSISAASVDSTLISGLLDLPTIKTVIGNYLSAQTGEARLRGAGLRGNAMHFSCYGFEIDVYAGGNIRVRSDRNDQRAADALAETLKTILTETGEYLFAERANAILSETFGVAGDMESVNVDDEGTIKTAYRLTLSFA